MNVFKKPTFWIIITVLAVFLFSIIREVNAGLLLEVSPAVFVKGDREEGVAAIIATQRFDNKFDVGMILVVDVYSDRMDNRGVYLSRTTQYKRLEIGFGYAWWGNESPAWNATNTFGITIGYRFGRNGIRDRHFSTGGSSSHNSGLDMLTVGREFGTR